MGIEDYSTVNADNDAAPPNGAPEGMSPSSVNDTMRQTRADIRTWYEDAQWIDYGHTPTRVDGDTFTVATDLTAIYHAGRRLKFTGSATAYGTIKTSSYSAPNTTVNLTQASLPATLSVVSIGAVSAQNSSVATPRQFGISITLDGGGSEQIGSSSNSAKDWTFSVLGTGSYRFTHGLSLGTVSDLLICATPTDSVGDRIVVTKSANSFDVNIFNSSGIGAVCPFDLICMLVD